MEIVSASPLPVGSVRWQQHSGAHVLTVHAKATFELVSGSLVLAAQQEPLHPADVHVEGAASRSVRAPCDIVPGKPRADVVLVGSAFAPKGKPAPSLVARLQIAEIDKAIEVFADRSFTQSGELRDGPPFTQMALDYERAAGGPETNNPVGVRHEARDGFGRRPVPNLQPTGLHVTDPGSWIEPIGFGPIAMGWPSRRAKVARLLANWSPADWSSRPLPEGFDHSFFNVAPSDQQLPILHDDEPFVLENLHRTEPRLVTKLPGTVPVAFLVGRLVPMPIALRPDTLWIDTDRAICSVTFRGQLLLERADEPGRVLVGLQMPGSTLTCADLERTAPPSSRDSRTGTMALSMADLHLRPASSSASAESLPFKGGGSTTATIPREPSQSAAGALPFGPKPSASGPGAAAVDQPSGPSWTHRAGTAPAAPSNPWQGGEPAGPAVSKRVGAMPALPAMAPPLGTPGGSPPPVPPLSVPPLAAAFPPPPVPPPIVPSAQPPPPPAQVASPWSVRPGMPDASLGGTPAAVRAMGHPPLPGLAPNAAAVVATPPAAVAAVDAAPPPPLHAERGPAVSKIVQLLWYEPDAVPRMRRQKIWRPLLEQLEARAPDPDLDDPALAEDAMTMEDRREVFEIVSRAERQGPQGVGRALRAAVRADGKFVPGLVLVGGELRFPFDELEALKATITTAEPLVSEKKKKKGGAPGDAPEDEEEDLARAVRRAKEFLKNPDLLSPPGVSAELTARIRVAFVESERDLPESYLDEQTDRVLLEKRHYQRRIVFGETYLRSLWLWDAEADPVPVYLPEALAKKLPLYQRFEARLIAEAHLREDQYERSDAALRAVALARIMPLPGSR